MHSAPDRSPMLAIAEVISDLTAEADPVETLVEGFNGPPDHPETLLNFVITALFAIYHSPFKIVFHVD